MSDALPIDDVLPEILAGLRTTSRLVVAAPPGAGKTTRVPLALLDEPWATGKLLLLEPRRIAARLAAERMAHILGEPLGRRVGLSTRIDRKVSAATRVEVMTEGVFTRRILNDPALEDVSAVLFDEFHERSLTVDLGLALARETQGALRDDLRLVVMSATLDVASLSRDLDAPTVESEGRAFPVETRFLGKPSGRLEDAVASAVRRALREDKGSILVFLPGQAEIRRTAEALGSLAPEILVAPLYGALSPRQQDEAVRPAPPGHRKVVLSTDLAESSLTIEDVRVVIDAGLSRQPVYDFRSGTSRLVTVAAARANVDQRRGRAGRVAPGVCYRLWTEGADRGLPPSLPPEIETADLSGLLLSVLEWGAPDPLSLPFLTPPPAGRIAGARERLLTLGATDESGRLTDLGRRMAQLPLPPELGALVAGAAPGSDRALAAEVAALIGERGLGGPSTDLRDRLRRFRQDGSRRASTLRSQAASWADAADPAGPERIGAILARALPHRVARRQGAEGRYLLAGGQAVRIDPDDPLGTEDWIAVADLTGERVLAAAPLTESEALDFGGLKTIEHTRFDPQSGSVRAESVRAVGAIVLSRSPLPRPRGAAVTAALVEAVRDNGLDLLPMAGEIRALQRRADLFADLLDADAPRLETAALLEAAADWLTPELAQASGFAGLDRRAVIDGILAPFDWAWRQALDDDCPRTARLASGREAPIDYLAEAGPSIEGRVQEFYGPSPHPAIARGRLPLSVVLLSPARRPVAVTKDLPGFWAGGYADMAKDMRGRYPKHDWPQDPRTAKAHEGRTKARL